MSDGIDWLEICNGVPRGMAQELSVSPLMVALGVKRLEEVGKVRVGEYEVRAYKDGNKVRVYLVRFGRARSFLRWMVLSLWYRWVEFRVRYRWR